MGITILQDCKPESISRWIEATLRRWPLNRNDKKGPTTASTRVSRHLPFVTHSIVGYWRCMCIHVPRTSVLLRAARRPSACVTPGCFARMSASMDRTRTEWSL